MMLEKNVELIQNIVNGCTLVLHLLTRISMPVTDQLFRDVSLNYYRIT
jgi:hypothetical protein